MFYRIRAEDIGFDINGGTDGSKPAKSNTTAESDGDPLVSFMIDHKSFKRFMMNDVKRFFDMNLF